MEDVLLMAEPSFWDRFVTLISDVNVCSVIFRLLLSVIAGAVIGWERGRHGRSAGLRTHILVSMGSAMSSLVGIFLITKYNMGDPSRIASGVVSGIGFLGAGTILIKNNSSQITGLTTAAAMWATAAVGLAFGAGFYVAGIAGTVVIFGTLTFMTMLELKRKGYLRFLIEISDASKTNEVIDAIQAQYAEAHDFTVLPAKSGIANHVGLTCNIPGRLESKTVLETLRGIEHVIFVVKE